MGYQTANNRLLCKQTAKRRFVLALAAGIIAHQGVSQAQDGIRELRNPVDMKKIAPVRAIGIRLNPAAPIDLAEKEKIQTKNPEAAVQPTKPSLPPRPILTAIVPPSPTGHVSDSVASDPPPVNLPSKSPDRILPKSKTVSVSIGKESAPLPLIRVQTPIQIGTDPTAIRTASAPSDPKQAIVEGLVATESKLVMELTPPADPIPSMSVKPLAPPSATVVTEPAVLTEPATIAGSATAAQSPLAPTEPEVLSKELEQAMRVEVDSQGTCEIPIDYPIREIVVRDEKVCRAMASDSSVYLIGLSLGESIVEIKSTEERPSRYLRVKVISPWHRSSGVMNLDQLVHTIQPLSTNGSLTVRAQEDGSVVIGGKVDSRQTAKRIMDLTRKLILVPVVDKLEIR